MSLILLSLMVGAGAASAGLWLRRRARRRASERQPDPRERSRDTPGLELAVGDVVSVQGEELWLEQGWLVTEAGRPLAGIFEAREGSLAEFASPRREYFRLAPAEVAVPAEAPMAIEHRAVRFERVRRLPVEVVPLGSSAPPPWRTALFFEYRALSGELLLVLGQPSQFRCWVGPSVSESAVERWGSA